MVAPVVAAAARTATTTGARAGGRRAATRGGTAGLAGGRAGASSPATGTTRTRPTGKPRGRAGGRFGGLTLTPPRRVSRRDLAGFAGGILVYVLTLNYLRHGPEGVKGWMSAKFLNRPDTSLAAPSVDLDDDTDDGAATTTAGETFNVRPVTADI